MALRRRTLGDPPGRFGHHSLPGSLRQKFLQKVDFEQTDIGGESPEEVQKIEQQRRSAALGAGVAIGVAIAR